MLRCLILGLLLSICQSNYVVQHLSSTNNGLVAYLNFQGTPTQGLISHLSLHVIYEAKDRVRFRITDLGNKRWEVPDIVLPVTSYPSKSELLYMVEVTEYPFGLKVSRKQDGQVIFNIDPSDVFQYNDQDIILKSTLDYDFFVYGIGERVTQFPLAEGIYTLFSRDAAGPYDNGKPPGKNMYSSQPVYLGVDHSGKAHGGFLLNSNAMDVSVTSKSIQFRTIGGVIDMFVFVGPKPEDVVKQYQELVGKPVLIPQWGLGWHHCRWGYKSLDDLKWVVDNYNKYRIPLDVVWSDIDYMYQYRDFTLDSERYPHAEFKSFVDGLHAVGRKFVPITDAGIAQQNYFAYNDGLEQNVYIKSPVESGPFVGKVWPGPAVYIDWFNPNSTSYWHNNMQKFRETVEFDGLWNDMNEASNFCNGECSGIPQLNIPYMPGETNLNTKTIDLRASHYNGYTEYDIHSLYGFRMSVATSTFFTEKLGTRPFVISRSSFPSHGRHASKWLGDNFSTFDWMAWSIPGIFNFQIFGIPLIGADICGFNGDTTEELCTRWFQVGTLYPFSRDHNSISSIPQEPWSFGNTLLEVSNWSIRTKYSLINYYYSQYFEMSLNGGSLFKPAFFEYPQDTNLLSTHSSDNFMIGPALIVHPVLDEGVSTVNAYFPEDTWYDWYTGEKLNLPSSGLVTLDAPLKGLVNIHMRGGSIIPKAVNYVTAMNLHELRYSNITLVVALDSSGSAFGSLVLDDGVSPDTISSKEYTYMNYKYSTFSDYANIEFEALEKGYSRKQGEYPRIAQVVIYGCASAPTSAYVGSSRVDVALGYDQYSQVGWVYMESVSPDEEKVLKINF